MHSSFFSSDYIKTAYFPSCASDATSGLASSGTFSYCSSMFCTFVGF